MEDEELQVLLRRYKSVSGLVNRAVGERDKTDYGRDMGQERTHYFLQDGMCSSSVMNFIRSWSQPAVLQLPLFAKHNPSSCSEWRDNELVKFTYIVVYQRARVFTTLDLTKGYWQIPLSQASKDKTVFSTLYGLYQFVTLPFGLLGAPATFQRLMDRVLRPHSSYAAAYLDDVIIHSNNCAEHMQRVAAVLEYLKQAEPLLHTPNFSLPFVLQTDASNRGRVRPEGSQA
ncbi:hypothetical protein F2P81_014495 [Scophthalmus maximus]|uniref:ribonuclease H n=1 Tax=Scophthalmus maximus TaxID=52904 RepID=A0A6A4SHX9_SCOMX|nr:hypothetical protein F2P81_014495 [Scophthalmus maximus]